MFIAPTDMDRTLLLDIQQGVKQLNLQATGDTSASKKRHMMMPFTPDPDFICRPSIENWMSEQFDRPTQRMALVGMGGFGYAHPQLHDGNVNNKIGSRNWPYNLRTRSTLILGKVCSGSMEVTKRPSKNLTGL
jgi:hypothetical protein